jgi:2-polyprenyl-3-methyl-5-hydroxy-6-metoxy-1,4-benzoquinol methylase
MTSRLVQQISVANTYSVADIENHLKATYSDFLKDDKMGYFFRNFHPKPGDRVLDVGCYLGVYDKLLGERYPEVEFVGIDIIPLYIQGAKTYSTRKNVSFRKADVLTDRSLKKGSFDHLFFFEVLEHVENPKAFLERFCELLKPNGRLYLSTPAALGITNILLNIRRQSLEYIKTEPRDTGTEKDHLYIWDKFTLYRLLYRSGFVTIEQRTSRKFSPRAGQSLCFIAEKQ